MAMSPHAAQPSILGYAGRWSNDCSKTLVRRLNLGRAAVAKISNIARTLRSAMVASGRAHRHCSRLCSKVTPASNLGAVSARRPASIGQLGRIQAGQIRPHLAEGRYSSAIVCRNSGRPRSELDELRPALAELGRLAEVRPVYWQAGAWTSLHKYSPE